MEESKKIGKFSNQDFIIFGEDFNRHPHALEHVLRPLFSSNRFIWVETIGLRSPKFNLYDMKRIWEKLQVWIKGNKSSGESRVVPKNIIIVAPFMIPFLNYSLIRAFNKWNVKRSVKKVIRENGMKNLITITSVPNAGDYVGIFNEKLRVYYCVDEFSLWPGLDLKLVSKLEKKLIDNVDLICATSEALSLTKKIPNKPTHIITHGVEFNHFNIGVKESFSNPVKLCYFGLFDERSDQKILLAVATHVGNCEIHIFGNVVCDISLLSSQKNIIFHGKVAYNDLPKLISPIDIFLLPYVRSELTNNINPLKLKEYLATGRPVIATALPEVAKLKEYLYLGNTSDDFITIVKELVSQKRKYDSQKTVNYIRSNETWESKANLLSSLILAEL